MIKPMISMTDIEKYYDTFHVLKNINFSVSEGEIVCNMWS